MSLRTLTDLRVRAACSKASLRTIILSTSVLAAAAMGCAGGGGAPTGGGGPVPPPEVATFDRIETEIFQSNCTTQSCHSAEIKAGDLVLTEDVAYDQLVGMMSFNYTAAQDGMMRVEPGDPDKSFLVDKLSGDLEPLMGEPMPRGGPYLNAKTLEIVRAWIEAGAPREGVVPGDDGSPLGIDDGASGPQLDPPTEGVQLHVASRALPRGTEETLCHYFKLPSDVDLEVNRIEFAVGGGSHHIHLYRTFDPNKTFEDGFEECDYAVDFRVFELVAVTQKPTLDWKLPEGVAIHFKAGEQLLMQTHFVNSGSLQTNGRGIVLVNLHSMDPAQVVHHAGTIFGEDRDVLVPALTMGHKQFADCRFTKPITMLGMTGHYHFRGVEYSVERMDKVFLPVPNSEIYHDSGYDDPLFLIYDDATAPRFDTYEGLRWTCTWDNPNNVDYKFGPFTSTNEHCNLFAFYYPTDEISETMTCEKEDNQTWTTVRSRSDVRDPY